MRPWTNQACYAADECIEVERLGEYSDDGKVGLGPRRYVLRASHDEHWRRRGVHTNFRKHELRLVAERQSEGVEENEVPPLGAHGCYNRILCPGNVSAIPSKRERVGEHLAEGFVVVCDQDVWPRWLLQGSQPFARRAGGYSPAHASGDGH